METIFHIAKIKSMNYITLFLKFKIREDGMDTHFIFGLVLVGFTFWLCFKYRKKK